MADLGEGAISTRVIYDSIVGDAATLQTSLFQQPIGQAAKTKYDTNMRLAGQISINNRFKVQGFACGCEPAIAKASLLLFVQGYFEFYVGGKLWYDCPIFTVPAGYGFQTTYEPANVGVGVVAENGVPYVRNILPLNREIPIEAGEEFRLDLYWNAAIPQDIQFWWFLLGEGVTPLQ